MDFSTSQTIIRVSNKTILQKIFPEVVYHNENHRDSKNGSTGLAESQKLHWYKGIFIRL